MFCSVQEAWPDYYNNNEKYDRDKTEINKNKNNKQKYMIENFEENMTEELDISETNNKYKVDKEEECYKFLKHLDKCHKCKKLLTNLNNNKLDIFKNLNITNEQKETIIIFLIGLLILLIIHIFCK